MKNDITVGTIIHGMSLWLESLPTGTEFQPKDVVHANPAVGSVTIACFQKA